MEKNYNEILWQNNKLMIRFRHKCALMIKRECLTLTIFTWQYIMFLISDYSSCIFAFFAFFVFYTISECNLHNIETKIKEFNIIIIRKIQYFIVQILREFIYLIEFWFSYSKCAYANTRKIIWNFTAAIFIIAGELFTLLFSLNRKVNMHNLFPVVLLKLKL